MSVDDALRAETAYHESGHAVIQDHVRAGTPEAISVFRPEYAADAYGRTHTTAQLIPEMFPQLAHENTDALRQSGIMLAAGSVAEIVYRIDRSELGNDGLLVSFPVEGGEHDFMSFWTHYRACYREPCIDPNDPEGSISAAMDAVADVYADLHWYAVELVCLRWAHVQALAQSLLESDSGILRKHEIRSVVWESECKPPTPRVAEIMRYWRKQIDRAKERSSLSLTG